MTENLKPHTPCGIERWGKPGARENLGCRGWGPSSAVDAAWRGTLLRGVH